MEFIANKQENITEAFAKFQIFKLFEQGHFYQGMKNTILFFFQNQHH